MSDDVEVVLPEVEFSDDDHKEMAEEFVKYAAELSWSLTPEALVGKLREWIDKYPNRISTAYWVTLDRNPEGGFGFGERDEGVRVVLARKKIRFFDFSLGALLGSNSGGLSLETPIYESAGGTRVAFGVGAVTMFDDPSKWLPALVVTVRIPLGDK